MHRMTRSQGATYTVEAYNLSHASENKIHNDAVARKLGFSGGLVPGVEVYAYACHPAVRRWGRDWLTRGVMECRFLKPVYDGRQAIVKAVEAGATLEITVESEGVRCATARASLSGEAPVAATMDSYPLRAPPPPEHRPPADETSLAPGAPLGIRPFVLTPDMAAQYLRDVREADPIYAEHGVAHPGQLLRLCNLVLRENVVLQPWVHTGSNVTNFAMARVGDELSARARVAANYERKGHRLVDLDVILIGNGGAVLAHVLHTAVYRLRQLQRDEP
jgi:acyl dehydratase